jgi:hypothetical protein
MPHFLFLLLAGYLGLAHETPAQEMPVSAAIQYPLLLKILSYDRNLSERAGTDLVIGVVYQSRYRPSQAVQEQLHAAENTSSIRQIQGHTVRLIPIDLTNLDQLEQTIRQKQVNVLYVTPLRSVDIRQLAALCQRNHIGSLTGMPEYLGQGLAVGIGIKENRPDILINLEAARSMGLDLSAQLLRLVTIVS